MFNFVRLTMMNSRNKTLGGFTVFARMNLKTRYAADSSACATTSRMRQLNRGPLSRFCFIGSTCRSAKAGVCAVVRQRLFGGGRGNRHHLRQLDAPAFGIARACVCPHAPRCVWFAAPRGGCACWGRPGAAHPAAVQARATARAGRVVGFEFRGCHGGDAQLCKNSRYTGLSVSSTCG